MKLRILLLFLISFSAVAQDAFRKERALRFGMQQDSIYRSAQALAKKRGIPLQQNVGKGRTLTFQGFSEIGEALYLRPESNAQAAKMTKTNLLYPGGSLNIGITGKSDTVKGKLGMWDGGGVLTTHQEFGGRVVAQQTITGTNEHSTHVAGILVAGGVSPSAKGMAYEADLKVWDYSNDNSEISTASTSLLISNHSYGYQAGWVYDDTKKKWQWWGNDAVSTFEDYKFGLYDANTQTWDRIAYNAPNYLIVKSAGNNRNENGPAAGEYYYLKTSTDSSNKVRSKNDGYDIISTSGTAKNILTVGAASISSLIPTKGSDVTMSSFTSWGPTDDGRVKPDVMAIGTSMFSTSNSGDKGYTTLSGTSMSSPQAAGSFFLIQQLYNRLNNNRFMLASTLKAVAIHTALDMEAVGPDYKTGFGLIQLDKAAALVKNEGNAHLLTEFKLNQGQTKTYTFTASGNGPVKATIAWTDPEGTTSSALNDRTPRLVNDLDIRISSGSSTFLPFTLDPASPDALAVPGDNIRDNVEQIVINNALPGQTYTLTVSHKGILKNSLQDYGLAVSGIGGAAYCAITPTTTSTNFQTFTLGSTKDSTGLSPAFKAELGASLPVKFTFAGSGTKQVRLYADWNQDGDFIDAGEELYNSASTATTISIPSNLVQDNYYRMRWVAENGTGSAPSCGSITSGESRDYALQILQASKDFTAISVSQPTAGVCASNGVTSFVARIKNAGSLTQTNVPVVLEIKSGSTLVGTATGTITTLASGKEIDLSLSGNVNISAGSSYTFLLKSQLTGDQNSANDLLSVSKTVENPAAPVVSGTVCSGATELNLSASNGSPLWYNGTTFLGAGATLKTPATGTFYATFDNLNSTMGPATKKVFGGGTYYGNFGPEPIFIVTQPTILESATVYIGTSGTVTFGIFDKDTGELIASVSKDLTATRTSANSTTVSSQLIDDKNDPGQKVTLNLPFPKAGNYILSHVCSNGASIYRSNRTAADTVNAPTNIGYPYEIPGVIKLTGALYNGAEIQSGYYYLYGMKFKSYACPSPTVQVNVTTGQSPVVAVSPTGNSTICVGDKITLTGTPASGTPTYQWYKNGTAIAGATTNKLDVTATGAYTLNSSFNGVCPVVSAASNVTAKTPLEPLITFNQGVLTTSAGTEIQWYLNEVAIPGATSTTYKPTANGTYKVKLRDVNGCLASATYGITILAVTADNPFATLYAFPNPAKNELHIGIPDAISASNMRVRISDMQGKEIRDYRVESRDNRLTLDISLLPAGNYVISFPELDGEASIKFQKN
jgi:Subtilase family/GEVED domain/Secretion system C-terminal sorting domain